MRYFFDVTKKMRQIYDAANPLNELPIKAFGIYIYQNNYRNYLEWLDLPWGGGDCMEDHYNESIKYADYLIEERNRRDKLKKSVKRSFQENLAKKQKAILPQKFPSHKTELAKVTKLW